MRIGAFALAAALVLCGCQEDLTAPADCPAMCPAGDPQIFEEVITPILTADSSFQGYVQPTAAPALLVSNGLRGYEERAILRYPRRSDSIGVRDTLRAYTIDSVALRFTVVARDTNLNGVQLAFYRVPPTVDSTTTYAQVDPAFVLENLVASVPLPDDLNSGNVRTVLQGADLARVAIPPSDSGVLALGLRLDAPEFTGIRLGTGGAGVVFETYVTLDIPDTGSARQRTISLSPAFNSTLSPAPEVDDPLFLTVGGIPASRALLRFDLPPQVRDSASVVRATLELTLVSPLVGLPTDPVRIWARGVLADLGAKSPVESRFGFTEDTLASGTSGTVSFEIARLVQQLWLSSSAGPTALVLSLVPPIEGGSFSRLVFYSTRASDPATRPRLRISYLRSYPFEIP